MFKIIYSCIYFLLLPFICLRWLIKSIRLPEYRESFSHRFGFVPKQNVDIWLHAVSVGESSGAVTIIKRLLALSPDLKIMVTTTTPTGAEVIRSQLKELLDKNVYHAYSPVDLPFAIKRVLSRLKPKLLVVMETELWPNWLSVCQKTKVSVILANARLSESSFQKYQKIPKTTQDMLATLESILSVNGADSQRFVALGAPKEKVQTVGNLKFDAEFETHKKNDYFPLWSEQKHDEKSCGTKKVWIAASTHAGEDSIVLEAHQQLLETVPDAKLIIVPRHPQRFDEVYQLLQKSGLNICRRSQPDSWNENCEILLGDSMGELLKAYQLCDIAFVAGSFVAVGGHNAIEAAFYAKPIITGPNIHNFEYLFRPLIQENAAVMVADQVELSAQLVSWFSDTEQANKFGKNAQQFIQNNQGALKKITDKIMSVIE